FLPRRSSSSSHFDRSSLPMRMFVVPSPTRTRARCPWYASGFSRKRCLRRPTLIDLRLPRMLRKSVPFVECPAMSLGHRQVFERLDLRLSLLEKLLGILALVELASSFQLRAHRLFLAEAGEDLSVVRVRLTRRVSRPVDQAEL